MNPLTQLTVLFDGACSLCRASVASVRQFDVRGVIEFLDLRNPNSIQRFPNVDGEQVMRSMRAVDRQGRVYAGVDAWVQIGLQLPGWNLVAWILFVPGVHWVAHNIYGWIARNRYRWNRKACSDGSCTLHLPSPPAKS